MPAGILTNEINAETEIQLLIEEEKYFKSLDTLLYFLLIKSYCFAFSRR